MSSEKVNISSEEFSIRLDNDKFKIDQAKTILFQDDITKKVGKQFVQNVGVGSNKNEKMYKFHELKPGQRYNLEMSQASIDTALECSIVTSCSCDQHTDDRTGRPGTFLVVHES